MIEFSGRILYQIQLDSPFVHSRWGDAAECESRPAVVCTSRSYPKQIFNSGSCIDGSPFFPPFASSSYHGLEMPIHSTPKRLQCTALVVARAAS